MKGLMSSRVYGSILALCAVLSFSLCARAQTYPSKPVHIIIPFGAGSSTDQLARALAQSIGEETKQPVVIETKPGANGYLGVQAVANAAPDGYTVLFGSSATHGINQFLFRNIPYDPVKDFSPVTPLSRGAFIFAVNSKSPVTTIQEFLDLARKSPGRISLATGTPGTRLAGELFQQITGAHFLPVPYKTIPAAITDLLGGQVEMTIADGGNLLAMVKTGRLRALGVSGVNRWESLPEVPTLRESGVTGYDSTYWTAAWLPANSPASVIARLNQLLTNATRAPAAKRFFAASAIEVFTMLPEEFAKFQISQAQEMGRLIKAAGIKPE